MKSSTQERIVWFLHPYRTMTLQTSKEVYHFKLQGFQIVFHPTFVRLCLVFDMGKIRLFRNLFPIFEESLQDLCALELAEVIHSPDESEGLVIKIPANIENYKFSPISIITDILTNRWQVKDVLIADDHRYAKLFHTLAPTLPVKKKLNSLDLRIN